MKSRKLWLTTAGCIITMILVVVFYKEFAPKNYHKNYKNISISALDLTNTNGSIVFGMETNWYDNQLYFVLNMTSSKQVFNDKSKKLNQQKKWEITYFDRYDIPILKFDPDTLSGIEDYNSNNIKEFDRLLAASDSSEIITLKIHGMISCSKDKYVNIKVWELKII